MLRWRVLRGARTALLTLAGFGLIAWGAAMIYLPAGLIAGGASLLLIEALTGEPEANGARRA